MWGVVFVNMQEIKKIQQNLYLAYITNKVGKKPYNKDGVYTGVQTDSGLGAKYIECNTSGNKDEKIANLCSDYFSTWLEVGYKDRIIIKTAVNRLKFSLFAPNKNTWIKMLKNCGLSGCIYTPYCESALTCTDFYSIQGSPDDFHNSIESWGEVVRTAERIVKERNQQEFERIQRKYRGECTDIKEWVNSLMPMIDKIDKSNEFWTSLYNHRYYKSGYHFFDFSKKNSISNECVSFMNNDGEGIAIHFEDIGFSSLKNADELIAFTVAFYCRKNGLSLQNFDFKSFTWEPAFAEGLNGRGDVCFSVSTPIKHKEKTEKVELKSLV